MMTSGRMPDGRCAKHLTFPRVHDGICGRCEHESLPLAQRYDAEKGGTVHTIKDDLIAELRAELAKRDTGRVTQGRCVTCGAPPGALCVRGCSNSDPTASGQPGAPVPQEHFEQACRGYRVALDEKIARGVEVIGLEEWEWLAAEEKRTAGR